MLAGSRANNPKEHDSSLLKLHRCPSLSPPAGKLPLLSAPSHGRGRISVDLTQKVHSLVFHDHLVHWPSYQHRSLCTKRNVLKHTQLMVLKRTSCGGRKIHGWQNQGLTIYHQLCRIAVPFSNHICAHTNIHASIAFPSVRDHQFSPTHLKNSIVTAREISLQGALREDADGYHTNKSSQLLMEK